MNLRLTEYPITDLWSIEGFKTDDYVYGQRLVSGDKAARVIDAFSISASATEAELDVELDAAARSMGVPSRVVPVERVHADVVWQELAARKVAHARVEAQLIRLYRSFRQDVEFSSFVTKSGKRADLYYADGSVVEVIEAKSLATHEKVREAAAQLLDYAAHSPEPATRLTGLFPQRPNQEGVDFMHRLGIDCAYRTDDGLFRTESADEERRRYMYPVWRDS